MLSRAIPAAHRCGRDLNRRQTKSFRLQPAGPQDSISAVAGVGQPPESKTHRLRSLSHGRGIGRLFGNGICPVIGGSSADACALSGKERELALPSGLANPAPPQLLNKSEAVKQHAHDISPLSPQRLLLLAFVLCKFIPKLCKFLAISSEKVGYEHRSARFLRRLTRYRRTAEDFTVINKSNFFDNRAMVRCEVDCLWQR
jgi:hypothetical protein